MKKRLESVLLFFILIAALAVFVGIPIKNHFECRKLFSDFYCLTK